MKLAGLAGVYFGVQLQINQQLRASGLGGYISDLDAA